MKINEIIELSKDFERLLELEKLDEQTIEDTAELINLEMRTKINNIVALYRESKVSREKNKQIAALYLKNAEKYERTMKNLETLIEYFMRATAKENIHTQYADISFRTSESVKIYNETLLPEEYFRVKKEPAKNEIKKAIQAGEEIDGAKIVINKKLQIK